MKRGIVLLLVVGLLFLFVILFCFNVKAGLFDYTGKSVFTGKATTQNTNVSITISGAPVLSGIDSLILACEGASLSYLFNASDNVGESLTFSITNPGIFFVRNLSSITNSTNVIYNGEIYSIVLTKSHAGNNYSRVISVRDESLLTDSESTNISVIEINNAPVMTAIGDKSVSLNNGGNFYYKVNVSDTEDGNQDSGNFSFNISFISGDAVFNISSLGIINKTFTSSEIGNYSVRVCATDLGIPIGRRHANISYCGQGDGSNRSDCETFNLEVSQQASQTLSSTSSGGSAGGGSIKPCEEKWGCESWDECKHAWSSLQTGVLNGEDYRLINDYCSSNSLSEEKCGYQRRVCFEINFCKTTYIKPSEIQACYYTENPSCSDGIKNCHDGDCEFLVDCGGPCGMCPTCNDGIQNQHEEGVDCGGPCPSGCISFSSPFKKKDFKFSRDIVYWAGGALLAVLFVIMSIKLMNVLNLRKN